MEIPKLGKGSYSPGLLQPRLRSEEALTAVIQEAYVHGVSTRSEDDFVKAMGMTGISKSQVSRLCPGILGHVDTFLSRPIEDPWPDLWIDATYVKVCQASRMIFVAGIGPDGGREVPGMEFGPPEAEPCWASLLRLLTRRGLRGIKLVISDNGPTQGMDLSLQGGPIFRRRLAC